VFFSHNKPVNSAFSTINQRNEQAVCKLRALDLGRGVVRSGTQVGPAAAGFPILISRV
jgi:hypothetical protein